MKNIAIFASGQGSNFQAIYKKIISGYIPAKICLVVSNNSNSGSISFARMNSIPVLIINKNIFPDSKSRDIILLNKLIDYDIELICLAGYMKLVPKNIVNHFKYKILNIHPALLPDFGGKGYYGIRVHQAVIKAKAPVSGVTIHLIDDKYDCGHILLQKKVSVKKNDTAQSLSKRVLAIEHYIYPKVIKAFCEGRIKWVQKQSKTEVSIEN